MTSNSRRFYCNSSAFNLLHCNTHIHTHAYIHARTHTHVHFCSITMSEFVFLCNKIMLRHYVHNLLLHSLFGETVQLLFIYFIYLFHFFLSIRLSAIPIYTRSYHYLLQLTKFISIFHENNGPFNFFKLC